jgi:hypothetical protein
VEETEPQEGGVTPLAYTGSNVAYLPHARAVESWKPRNTHATIELQVLVARC